MRQGRARAHLLWTLVCAVALAVVGVRHTAWADARPIFAWIDARGTLHATNNLDEVPEPYYSTYRARRDAIARAQQAAARAGREADTPPSNAGTEPLRPAASGATRAQHDARVAWQARMLQARSALIDATLAVQQAEGQLADARRNPILAQTPAGKAQVAAAERALDGARRAALAARKTLMLDLPAEARDQHVPPQWLL